ncbi:sigma-70 family RNA polymerase sigma factor [Tistrella bauzanensis]|uniref:Sigma-70 family RNA polymerase sigma factor n=1 Tax=Tistrella arctica TaxID=3133430 RepID=A0ABU9YR76_9PROT
MVASSSDIEAAGRPEDEDDRLLARVAAGDGAAFGRLVDRHGERALAVATRMLSSRSDAEDAVQDVFTRLWAGAAARWRPGGARFGTWLWRAVANRCLDQLRRPRMTELTEAMEPPDPSPGALDRLIHDRTMRRVGDAVAGLPERQRMAIALVYDAGLSGSEAADAMGVSAGAMEQLLVRARRSLRLELKTGMDEDEGGA